MSDKELARGWYVCTRCPPHYAGFAFTKPPRCPACGLRSRPATRTEVDSTRRVSSVIDVALEDF